MNQVNSPIWSFLSDNGSNLIIMNPINSRIGPSTPRSSCSSTGSSHLSCRVRTCVNAIKIIEHGRYTVKHEWKTETGNLIVPPVRTYKRTPKEIGLKRLSRGLRLSHLWSASDWRLSDLCGHVNRLGDSPSGWNCQLRPGHGGRSQTVWRTRRPYWIE